MGAELAALGGVEPALEQGAEDGDVDGAPVQVGGAAQFGQVGRGEGLYFFINFPWIFIRIILDNKYIVSQ